MELKDLLVALSKHNRSKRGFQIHLNSGNLDEETSSKHMDVEFSDMYFSNCELLKNTTLLCFSNTGRNPVGQSEDGKPIYPCEVNSSMYIDISKIESIEDEEDFIDWFEFPSERLINLYMFPEDYYLDGNRNVVSIGFMA